VFVLLVCFLQISRV